MTPDTRPVITVEEAAERLGTNRLNVFRLMDSGRLRSVDIGTRVRRHRRTSEVWLAEFQGTLSPNPVEPAVPRPHPAGTSDVCRLLCLTAELLTRVAALLADPAPRPMGKRK